MDAIKELTKTIGTHKKSLIVEREEMQQRLQQHLNLDAEQVARELDRRCKFCEALLIPEQFPTPDRKRPFTWLFPDRCGCPGEEADLAKREAERTISEAQIQQQLLKNRLKSAGLIGDLELATFDNFKPRNDWDGAEDAKKRAQDYLAAYYRGDTQEKPILLMTGQWGTGKSHLAAAVVHHVFNKAYFRNWTDYLQRLQNSWSHRGNPEFEQEEDIINELREGDLVVIDDLDKRNPSEWVRSVLYPVINHRCNMGLATIITLNYGPDDADPRAPGRPILQTYFGVAVLDRIIGKTFDLIEFTGPSYRSGIEWKV
jgi:DNA replication protein DnaC